MPCHELEVRYRLWSLSSRSQPAQAPMDREVPNVTTDRSHLTDANVMDDDCRLHRPRRGATAVALNGSNTVQSDDLGPGAQVKAADVADNAVKGADSREQLADRSRHRRSKRRRYLQADADREARPDLRRVRRRSAEPPEFDHLLRRAAGLRLPTWSEAVAMAKNYDVPGVSADVDSFWTDSLTNNNFQQEFGPIVVEGKNGDWAVHIGRRAEGRLRDRAERLRRSRRAAGVARYCVGDVAEERGDGGARLRGVQPR